jgi:hypothetical protein
MTDLLGMGSSYTSACMRATYLAVRCVNNDSKCNVARRAAMTIDLNLTRVHRWLRERGCEWDESTCVLAAQNGHLHCLR